MPQRPTSPAWEKIANDLIEKIGRGQYAAGDQLPSAQALSEQHKVARGTAVKALEFLRAGGYVETRPGYGTFVRDDIEISPVDRLREIAKELTQIADALSREGR